MTNRTIDQQLLNAKSYAKKGDLLKAQKQYEEIIKTLSNKLTYQQGLIISNKSDHNNVKQSIPKEIIDQLFDLYNQGQIATVIKQAEVLTKQYPEAFLVWKILGASNISAGMFDKSVECYKKCISLKPENADLYNDIGVAFQGQGKFEEAIFAYKKALSISPNHAGVYYNIGLALSGQCKLKDAVNAYKKAIFLKPDYAEAYNNLGNILQEQGNLEESIDVFKKALLVKPDYDEAYFNISNSFEGISFKKPNQDLQKIISTLLDKKTYVKPQEINSSVVSLLKVDTKLKKYLELQTVSDLQIKLPELITDLTDIPLLLKFMSVCPIADKDLEKLIKNLRNALLMSIKKIDNTVEFLSFQSALALQCYTNEYIYGQTRFEEKALKSLEELVKQKLKNKIQPCAKMILCLSSYKPLNHYEWSNSLIVTDAIKDVFIRQFVEPKVEDTLKQSLPSLTDISEKTSQKVRAQYEKNPYPRWVNLKLQFKPLTISRLISEIKLKIFDHKIRDIKSPDILIAGCGTGQHSIETATRFKDSKVLAIDLSKSSLSYAKRKTYELGIKNIDYVQADILNLDKLDKKFDIVESVGVLHHMTNPIAGWRALTDCLKQGGLMKIGLYSELARQDIVKMRKEIGERGLGSCDAEMRSFRNMLMKSDKSYHKLTLSSPDLYTMSTLKDLLYHVKEHRFTLKQIQDCLSELELKFCGFESRRIVSYFKQGTIMETDPYNLDKWHAFEQANPRMFSGMYQFWCQKII